MKQYKILDVITGEYIEIPKFKLSFKPNYNILKMNENELKAYCFLVDISGYRHRSSLEFEIIEIEVPDETTNNS